MPDGNNHYRPDDCSDFQNLNVEAEAGLAPSITPDEEEAADISLVQAVDSAGAATTGPSTPLSKRKVVMSLLWGGMEIYAGQLLQFAIGIFLARKLMPAQYGTIAIIGIFIQLSQVFIDSGLPQALVRKKNVTAADLSTVFYTNMAVACICYALIYFFAPAVGSFYADTDLTPALRVMGLSLIIGAVSGVMRTMLIKELAFKTLAIISLVAGVVSGATAIAMAYSGCGIWSLVTQNILMTLVTSFCIICLSPFRPKWLFSVKSLRELFGFGSKLLGSSIIWAVFGNIYTIVIGKALTPTALGYYSRADGYGRIVPANVSRLFTKVMFPVVAKIQDDNAKLNSLFTRSQSMTSFAVFGINCLLAGLAYPLVLNMISAKWLPCVPLLQIICIGAVFDPIAEINGQFLIAKGHSGAFLKMHIITLPTKLILLVATIWFGLIWIAVGRTVVAIVEWIVSAYYFKKLTTISTRHFYFTAIKMGLTATATGLLGFFAFRLGLPPTWGNTIVVMLALVALYIGAGMLLFRSTVTGSLHACASIFKKA